MNQLEREAYYSRKNIPNVIMDTLDGNDVIHEWVEDISLKLVDFRTKEHSYVNKQMRVDSITQSNDDIAVELIANTISLEKPTTIQQVVSSMSNMFSYMERTNALITAAEVIAVCKDVVYNILPKRNQYNNTNQLAVISMFKLPEGLKHHINQTKYLPPMIEQPMDWTANNHGGYLTLDDNVILGHLNKHRKKQSLDVINMLQHIVYSLNEPMLEYTEVPNKDLDTKEKIEQFHQMKEESTEVYAELLEQGNKFYYVWKFDKRGRMYSQGYHSNLQGTQYKKSILNFNKEEYLND